MSLDGTKVAANASKHKAMSYERMSPTEQRLQQEVEQLLEEAEQLGWQEDDTHGKGKRGDELPIALKRGEDRLAKIRAAKAALEAEARDKAQAEAQRPKEKAEQRARIEQQTGKKVGGRKPPPVPDPEQAVPEPKAQRNFTDGESRIMPDGSNKGAFMLAYNAQIVVDGHAQVIVASDLTQQPNDKLQVVPMLALAKENLSGETPEKASADAGYYYSNEAVHDERLEGIDLYVSPVRQKHGQAQAQTLPADPTTSAAKKMRNKLSSPEGKDAPTDYAKLQSSLFSARSRKRWASGARPCAEPTTPATSGTSSAPCTTGSSSSEVDSDSRNLRWPSRNSLGARPAPASEQEP